MSELTKHLPSQAEGVVSTNKWFVDSQDVALLGHDPVRIASVSPFSLPGLSFISSGESDVSDENGENSPQIAPSSGQLYSPYVLGRERLSYRWPKDEGPLWLFASRENLEAFKAAPSRYAPQIGGYDLGALLSDKPALVPLSEISVLRHDGEIFFYNSGSDIDFEKLDEKAIKFAKDAYRKLTDPKFTGIVEPYRGDIPRLDTLTF
jgi:hypothetical protein